MGEEIVHALKGVTFTVEKGEFVTIMGSSGSGKSTLLNIIGCLDKPSSGDYILDGINIKNLDRDELAVLEIKKSVLFSRPTIFSQNDCCKKMWSFLFLQFKNFFRGKP
jgi:ABC-type lipoprotein export system ATPase subunit